MVTDVRMASAHRSASLQVALVPQSAPHAEQRPAALEWGSFLTGRAQGRWRSGRERETRRAKDDLKVTTASRSGNECG